jgi:hypothetical protein
MGKIWRNMLAAIAAERAAAVVPSVAAGTAADGTVPRPTPRVAASASRATLPAQSIGFFIFSKASIAGRPVVR